VERQQFVRRFEAFQLESISEIRDNGLKVLEAQLGKSKFVAGADPTIGDIGCYGVLVFAKEANSTWRAIQNITAWMARVEKLRLQTRRTTAAAPRYRLAPAPSER